MEYNNLPVQYKWPRTAFYAQTEPTNQEKLERLQRYDNPTKTKKNDIGPDQVNPYVYGFVKENVNILPDACRAINDKGDKPTDCAALDRK